MNKTTVSTLTLLSLLLGFAAGFYVARQTTAITQRSTTGSGDVIRRSLAAIPTTRREPAGQVTDNASTAAADAATQPSPATPRQLTRKQIEALAVEQSTEYARLLADPHTYAAMKVDREHDLRREMAAFIQNSGLSAAQARQLLSVLAEESLARIERFGLAGGDFNAASTMSRSADAEYRQKIAETFGPDIARQLQEYQNDQQPWTDLHQLASDLANGSTELTLDQKRAIVSLLSSTHQRINTAAPQVRALLTPSQQIEFDRYVAEQLMLAEAAAIDARMKQMYRDGARKLLTQ